MVGLYSKVETLDVIVAFLLFAFITYVVVALFIFFDCLEGVKKKGVEYGYEVNSHVIMKTLKESFLFPLYLIGLR